MFSGAYTFHDFLERSLRGMEGGVGYERVGRWRCVYVRSRASGLRRWLRKNCGGGGYVGWEMRLNLKFDPFCATLHQYFSMKYLFFFLFSFISSFQD
jgi:hypothetical protein